jgi:hypothetical protein
MQRRVLVIFKPYLLPNARVGLVELECGHRVPSFNPDLLRVDCRLNCTACDLLAAPKAASHRHAYGARV